MTNISIIYEMPVINETMDMLGYANSYSGGYLVGMLVMALWVILFMWFKRYEINTAFAGANVVTLLISVPLGMITFQGSPILNPHILAVLIILTGISAVLVWKKE